MWALQSDVFCKGVSAIQWATLSFWINAMNIFYQKLLEINIAIPVIVDAFEDGFDFLHVDFVSLFFLRRLQNEPENSHDSETACIRN